MSLYTTPLQFAYFFGWLFTLILLCRGIKESRNSEMLLSLIIFTLTMEIQDYTLGFSGINFLWEKLNGFPRSFQLLLAPSVYLYIRSQSGSIQSLKKSDWMHFLPFLVYFVFHLIVFFSGTELVRAYQKSDVSYWISHLEMAMVVASYIYYFYKSLSLLRVYNRWTKDQFSNQEKVSLSWLKTLIYLIVSAEILRFGFRVIDWFLDLPFNQDWWWHLWTICIIIYLSLKSYIKEDVSLPEIQKTEILPPANDYSRWEKMILHAFESEKVYLDPNLSLTQLSQKLQSSPNTLSHVINHRFGKNFNDFVNEYRVKEYLRISKNEGSEKFTKIGLAYDSGFNSKSTFMRALKKYESQLD